jgi:hypothetical protein
MLPYITFQAHPHHPGLAPFPQDFRTVHAQSVLECYVGLDAAWPVNTMAFTVSHVIHFLSSLSDQVLETHSLAAA